MTKNQIKMLTTKQLEKLSKQWLITIACRYKTFGNVSLRAEQVLISRGYKATFVR